MKIYDKIWNYSLDDIPNINDKIMICQYNQDNDFPYLVEDIKYEKRDDYNFYIARGRQLKKNGQIRRFADFEIEFELYFTDKPKNEFKKR